MHPVLFHIGSFAVRSYGVLMVAGFMLAVWRTTRVCARRMATEPEDSPRRIHPDRMFDLALVVFIAGLAGARIVFVALDWADFAHDPWSLLRIWEGGLSLHGSILFGIPAMIIYCRRHRLSPLVVGDLTAPAFAIAYAIGRVGCLLNGCCYGIACALPWAVRFPSETGPGLTPPSHPIQAYDAVLNGLGFLGVAWWERRPHRDGELFFGYMAYYGVIRFALEYLRAGATSTYLVPALHLTDTHLASVAMVAIGVAGIAWLRSRRPAAQDAAFAPGAGAAART